MGNDCAEKAVMAAKVMRWKKDRMTDADKRLEEARLAQIRFDCLGSLELGRADTQRRYADERYIG